MREWVAREPLKDRWKGESLPEHLASKVTCVELAPFQRKFLCSLLMFSILFNRTVPALPAGHQDIACKLGFWVSSSIDCSSGRHGNGNLANHVTHPRSGETGLVQNLAGDILGQRLTNPK